MGAFFTWLNGKKTYFVAAGGVLIALGDYLTGAMSADAAIQLAFTAIVGATLRHGITTAAAANGDAAIRLSTPNINGGAQ